MKSFPLPGVKVKKVRVIRDIASPCYTGVDFTASQQELRMSVTGVGDFHAADGNRIEYSPAPGSDSQWVKLYLNNQMVVALLHQRKVINFHASSFIHEGRGVIVLGDTGAGKSSLAIASSLEGDGFLTDDLTPVVFRNGFPFIWPLARRVKIRRDTAEQLRIDPADLLDAEPGTGKKYLILNPAGVESSPLDTIIRIEVGAVSSPFFFKPEPSEKFAILRSEICSWEFLAGMPVTEEVYLQQLVQIIEKVHFVRVVRPAVISIAEMHEVLGSYLERLE